MKHTLSVLVQNKSGVLVKVAGMFSRRGYNINSLAVGTTERQDISRMTIVVEGDERVIEQVIKQLHKQVEVLKISDITGEKFVDRELILIKVDAKDAAVRNQIMQIVDIFRGHIVDICADSVMVEGTGNQEKLSALEDMLRPFGIREVVRTGKIAMVRGSVSKLG